MDRLKLHDLRCFEAVATHGSFQAAASALNRSHPSVFAAVAKLENSLGLRLFDRSSYRVSLTEEGVQFHARAKMTLREVDELQSYAGQLASGEEAVFRVLIGDLMPRPPLLRWLSAAFAKHRRTKLHIEYGAVGGPLEKLLGNDVDLIFHRADPSDPRLERVDLLGVTMIPVVAPGFLPDRPVDLTPAHMRQFTQCVIRDTAEQLTDGDYFLVEGAHQCSAPDQQVKKELILNGLAWGHLPSWLIEEELRNGMLISIAGRHLPGRSETIAAIRLRRDLHGPVMQRFWGQIAACASAIQT